MCVNYNVETNFEMYDRGRNKYHYQPKTQLNKDTTLVQRSGKDVWKNVIVTVIFQGCHNSTVSVSLV